MHNEYDISVSDGVELLIPEDEIISTCNFVLAQEKVVRPCMVSISIVSDEEIRTVNRTWRNADAVTDVISLEVERPNDEDLAPGEPCELGDILLAPACIKRQAATYHTTPADEFRLMLVHAML
ncbi:MAG: rRNA maturation RNase YbeY, partial [Lancefieldella rimae]